jgi:CheY-like chemotaxis protein
MRVLIVDPEPTRGPALMESLRTGGAEVTVAPSGSFALTMLERNRHDVVLSRARMDDMDGHELCAILKADPGTRDVRFVLVASPGEVPADVTTAAGVDLVLPPAMTGSAIVPLILRLVQANRAAAEPAAAAPPAAPEPEAPAVPRIRPELAPPPQAEPPKRYVSAIAAAAAAPWSKESEPAVALPPEAPVPGIAPPGAAPATTVRPAEARPAPTAPPPATPPAARPPAAAPRPAATPPRAAPAPARPGAAAAKPAATPGRPAAAAGKPPAAAPARPQSAPAKPGAAPARAAAAPPRPGAGPSRPAAAPPRAPAVPGVVDLNSIPSGTFQGSLEVLDLADVTQAIAGGGKSGRLILALPQGGGVMLFDKGRVVHAEYRNTVGEEAFGALLAASHGNGAGRFCFLPTPAGQTSGTPHTIDKTVDRLLLSSATAIDEKG